MRLAWAGRIFFEYRVGMWRDSGGGAGGGWGRREFGDEAGAFAELAILFSKWGGCCEGGGQHAGAIKL